MSKKLAMDDLQQWMFVTVLHGATTTSNGFGRMGPVPTSKEDRSDNGNVLRIVAVEMPYFAVEFYAGDHRIIKQLDAREVVFGSISPEYVKALEPKFSDVEFIEQEDWVFEQEVEK